MKFLTSVLTLSVLMLSSLQAEEPKDKCGCAKPKPTQPAQVAKPTRNDQTRTQPPSSTLGSNVSHQKLHI